MKFIVIIFSFFSLRAQAGLLCEFGEAPVTYIMPETESVLFLESDMDPVIKDFRRLRNTPNSYAVSGSINKTIFSLETVGLIRLTESEKAMAELVGAVAKLIYKKNGDEAPLESFCIEFNL